MEFTSIGSYIKRLAANGDSKKHIVRMLNQEKKLSKNKDRFGLRVNYFIKAGF